MNNMVFQLQPDIVINNRSWMAGDFSTPEQSIDAAKGDWESCMTLNDHWGYGAADDNWKTPKTLVSNLAHCAMEGGNYLLNIGPKADGSVPEASVRILHSVGGWVDRNNAMLSMACTNAKISDCRWSVLQPQGQHHLFLYSELAGHFFHHRRNPPEAEVGQVPGLGARREIRAEWHPARLL